jgi:flavin reductase (DIM6/NTAB) family NADH-FMN oxidoreductase RutF
MSRLLIPSEELLVKPHNLWANQWLLLTSGDFAAGDFNTMTVAWGSMGTMWSKPFVQVVVRFSRYTFQFTEKYDSFTLSALPSDLKPALQLLGTKSGRDGDKIGESGLTPVASAAVAAPGFAEAELILECQKIYWDDMNPAHFLNPAIEKNYRDRDYHRIYFGEVVAVTAEAKYSGT